MILRRLTVAIPVLLIVSIFAFLLIQLVPGDPAVTLAGDSPSPEQIELIRQKLGTDQPLVVQYLTWLGHALTGDLGSSLFTTQDVTAAIAGRLPVTLSLSFGALAVALVLGVPAGVVSGIRRNSLLDRAIGVGSSIGLALPNYFVGILLILIFALQLGWLPATNFVPITEDPVEWARTMVLPSIALGLVPAGVVARQLRSSMIGVMQREYIQTAESKGLSRRSVVVKHALRNAAIPAVTALSAQFAIIVGGTVVIEQIFSVNGMGSLAYSAVVQRDIPMIQGVVLVTALIVQLINILVDLLYGWLNPRVKVS